jgi:hypothetical protein
VVRYNCSWSILLFVLILSAPGGLRGANGVLDVIPEDALGIVVMRDATHTNDQIAELAVKLDLEAPNVLALVQSLTGLSEGVAFGADVALALVTSEGEDRPIPIAVLPVTDFDAFIKSLDGSLAQNDTYDITLSGRASAAIRKGDFVVLAEASNRAILPVVASSTTGVRTKLEPIASWTRQTDVYAVGLPRGIAMAQREILAGLAIVKQQIRTQMEQQGEQAEQAEQVVKGIEIYEQLFGSLDKELALMAVAIRLEDSGHIHLRSRTVPKPDGILAKLSSQVVAAEGDWFRGIPQGPFVFAGGGVYPADGLRDMTDFSMQMMKSVLGIDLGEQELDELKALTAKSAEGVRAMSVSMGVVGEGEPLYGNVVLALHVDDADAYLETYQETIEKMAEFGRKSAVPFFEYAVSRFDIDGLQGLQLEMDMNAMAAFQPGPQEAQTAIMQAMFGEDGKMRVFLAAADQNTILGTYVSRQRLTDAVAGHREDRASFSQMAEIEKVRGLLPADAVLLGYWSIGGTFAFVRTAISAMAPEVPAEIPPFPDTVPIGLAISVDRGGIDSDLVVPLEASRTLSQFVKAMMEPAAP